MNLLLETPRLTLIPTATKDIQTLHNILINPYVRKYLCDDKIFSWQQTQEMLKESQKLFASEKFGLWLIKTKEDKEIIGFVGLWYFFEETQPQIAYALLPKATKQGYATEAASKILEYSFKELNYSYLIASCDRPNHESQQVAIRIGMRQIEEKDINGNPTLFFRIDKSLFEAKN